MTLQEHMNPLYARKVSIVTPFSVTECVERMRSDIAPFWAFWGTTQGLKGRVSAEGFTVRRYTASRRALPSEARGHFEPGGQGTRLEFEIGWRRLDLVVIVLAVAFVPAMAYLIAAEDPTLLWAPWLFLLAILVASAIHRVSTLHDDDWVVSRLCELLDGREFPVAT